MTEYFVQQDLEQAKKLKTKTLINYLLVLGLYVVISAGLLMWYLALPYKSPTIALVKWIHYPLTIVMVLFSAIYLGIKYKRVKRYYLLAFNLINARKETSEGSFLEYSEWLQDKDGVDCKALIFLEWNKYKKDYFERKVLVLYDRPFPEIPEKAKVRYVTQGNVLFSYEILEQ